MDVNSQSVPFGRTGRRECGPGAGRTPEGNWLGHGETTLADLHRSAVLQTLGHPLVDDLALRQGASVAPAWIVEARASESCGY